MKREYARCDPAILNRFFDQELGQEERAAFSQHLKDCPSCQKALRENEHISAVFKAGLDKELSQINFNALDHKVSGLIRRKKSRWWMMLKDFFASRKFFVPATAAAAILILTFSLTRGPASLSGPSAIINSLTGDVSSVMIIETPKSRQTIIWFSEIS